MGSKNRDARQFSAGVLTVLLIVTSLVRDARAQAPPASDDPAQVPVELAPADPAATAAPAPAPAPAEPAPVDPAAAPAQVQVAPAPVDPAAAPAQAPAPATPAPTLPTSREAALEERLRQMEARQEATQRAQNERFEAMMKELQNLRQQVGPTGPPVAGAANGPAPGVATGGGGGSERPDHEPYGVLGRDGGTVNNGSSTGAGTAGEKPEAPEGGGVDGTDGPRVGVNAYSDPTRTGGDTTRGGGQGRGPQGTIGRRGTEGESRPIKTTIGNGLRFNSEDGEFQLQFHDLTQSELRNFPGVGDQSPLKTQFFIPRQRWYFTGRATKNVEFYTVINRGYGSLDLLDAFINFNFDPRFQFRVGRTKTPTSYEYYQIAEGDLIAPERSLFIGNLAGNRQNGFMLHGQIFEKSTEYAVGVFNGPRRSFYDYNSDKDLFLFYNMRPFQNTELTGLKYFNVGGAYNFGNEHNPLQPNGLSTANDQTTSNITSLSPTFFQFNNNVTENGWRAQWSAWIAWYYKSFNILAEYDGMSQDYSNNSSGAYRTRVPYEGFSITPYYFLTGERITRRVDIQPDRDFGIKNGRITGPGAFEVFSRFTALNVGSDVFTGGLADRNLWSNHAYTVDTGLNWYLNRYTKIYLDWQYSGFGNPVYNGKNSFADHYNLLWLRFQLFF